jgi:hypothetical protein
LEKARWTSIPIEPLAGQTGKLRAAPNAAVFAVACGTPAQDGMEVEFPVAGFVSTLKPTHYAEASSLMRKLSCNLAANV